jgi:hypothetical protein
MGFTYHKAWGKIYHEPNLHRSWGKEWEWYYVYFSIGGEKLCLLIGIIFLPLLRSRHNIPPISEEGNSISEEGKLMNIRCPPNTLQIFSECFSMQYILIFRKCWFCIWKAGQLRSFYATEHALIALFCYLVLSLGLLSPQALL